MRACWFLIGVLFMAASSPAPSHAQDEVAADTSEPSSEVSQRATRRSEAHSLFLAGRTAFENGRFENALRHFRDSYELFPAPELLYNIGQSADRMRLDEEALDAFTRFLAERSGSLLRAQLESRIRTLHALVEEHSSREHSSRETLHAEPVADTEQELDAPDEDLDGRPHEAEGDSGGNEIVVNTEVRIGRGDPETPLAPSHTWLMAVIPGGALIVAGAALATVGGLDVRAVENAGPGDYPTLRSRDERSALFTGIGFASLGLGTAALALGLILRPHSNDPSGLQVVLGLGSVTIAGSL